MALTGPNMGADNIASLAVWPPVPTVIGHRGASALFPEHTIASYARAIDDGADFIEPDLVSTKDGVLVARHENAICIVDADGKVTESTTDVADHPEFAGRRATKTIDGMRITGWFTEDFTLAELKTLRARERIPEIRPGNAGLNDQFEIPTLQEIIDLARAASSRSARTVGIYAETKHPSYFRSIGLALEPRVIELLANNRWNDRDAPVFLQSFEPSSLIEMGAHASVRMVQLIEAGGRPADADTADLAAPLKSYDTMTTPGGLAEVARYAVGIGPIKHRVRPVLDDRLGAPTRLVADAHAAGLLVHVWTLRPENAFLPGQLRAEPIADKSTRGDSSSEIRAFIEAGVDGLFCDDPGLCRAEIDTAITRR